MCNKYNSESVDRSFCHESYLSFVSSVDGRSFNATADSDRSVAQHAVALNSCTAALHLSMVVSGIGPGDEVITCPMTFAATANAILHCGARPVFVDCRRDTCWCCRDKWLHRSGLCH